jgi:hypothetical protein
MIMMKARKTKKFHGFVPMDEDAHALDLERLAEGVERMRAAAGLKSTTPKKEASMSNNSSAVNELAKQFALTGKTPADAFDAAEAFYAEQNNRIVRAPVSTSETEPLPFDGDWKRVRRTEHAEEYKLELDENITLTVYDDSEDDSTPSWQWDVCDRNGDSFMTSVDDGDRNGAGYETRDDAEQDLALGLAKFFASTKAYLATKGL